MAVSIDPKILRASMSQAPPTTAALGARATTLTPEIARKTWSTSAGQFAADNWWWLLPIILGWYMEGRQKAYGQCQATALETEHFREMKETISPEDMLYQAMMPAAQQEQDMVSTLLLQQLLGDRGELGPQLARGEERIGGQRGGGLPF